MTHTPNIFAQIRAHTSIDETIDLLKNFIKTSPILNCKFNIASPITFLETLKKQPEFHEIDFGVDLMLNPSTEVFTGSTAIPLLKKYGAKFTLIASKKERLLHNELSCLKLKIQQALQAQIRPIICIYDTQEQADDNLSKTILQKDLFDLISDCNKEDLKQIYFLYDAAWINNTPLENDNVQLKNAYKIFKETLEESLKEPVDTLNIIYAIPKYSPDVQKTIESVPAFGYSVGFIN